MKYNTKRKRLPPKQSKKLFRKTAGSVHPKNGSTRPMRGGYRL